MTRVAAIDCGTNSLRLLITDVLPGRPPAEVLRRMEIVRLGAGVDKTGVLAPEAIERTRVVLAEYAHQIAEHGAERMRMVATSATRDAGNRGDFEAMVTDLLGQPAQVISGSEEAALSFRGATASLPSLAQLPPPPYLVVDIGGGSTELVVGRPGEEPTFHVSTQSGAVRQTERHLDRDPPEPRALSDLALEVQLIIEEAVPEAVRAGVGQGIAVAGTATSLAAVDQELEPYDPARVDGYRLELGACERMLAMLAGKTTAERRELPGLHPGRAPTIVAGAVILVEVMRAFGLDAVRTSEADILHGAALSVAG